MELHLIIIECSSAMKYNAHCQRPPFSHALIVDVYVIRLPASLLSSRSFNNNKAHCQCSPFSQELIAALYVMTLASISLLSLTRFLEPHRERGQKKNMFKCSNLQ
jgi:hypothetical protein